ncbi:hypothetical protein IJS98_03105 [bacterium]|nr:hypothetical protein [bacterium]
MKKLFTLALALITVASFADGETLYKCGFEADEGFTGGATIDGVGTWYKADTRTGDCSAESDDPAVGGQYAKQAGEKYLNFINTFDISEVYEAEYAGLPLDVYAYVKWPSDAPNTWYIKFQGLTGSFTTELEIMEFQIKNNRFWFCHGDGTGNTPSWEGNNLQADVWYKVGGIIDPATRTILSLYIDDMEFDSETAGYQLCYKHYAKPEMGKYPNSIRLQNTGCVDDITVEVIPETASVGLLALVGLCFLRKRGQAIS